MSAPERGESGEITAEAQIPANSRWFCGHFPDDPVLPAIAQLGMLVDMIARAEKHPLRLASASRFKFKRWIGPENRLALAARPGDESGQYLCHIKEASGGVLVLIETTKPRKTA